MQKPDIIKVKHLFPDLYSELIKLLEKLSEEEWYLPTSSSKWNVKDIVAHLVDGDLRRLSFQRDNLAQTLPEKKISSYEQLVDYLNQLNNSWIEVARRLSPEILIDLLRYTRKEISKLFNSLDLNGKALFGVSWAGEEESANWFDIAREYTERWYHQQQIREAVGIPLLVEEKWIYPLIDTFIRGLPNTFEKHLPLGLEGIVVVEVEDISNGKWTLQKEKNWELYVGEPLKYSTRIILSSDTAWRIFSKSIKREEAKEKIRIEGEEKLALLILELTTFMK